MKKSLFCRVLAVLLTLALLVIPASALTAEQARELLVETYVDPSDEDILRTDYKIFSSGSVRFGVGHGSFMTEKNLRSAEALLTPYLPTALAKQRLDYIFFMFTFIPTSTTKLVMAGDGAQELTARAFHAVVEGDAVSLPGVVSRKKQVIPALLSAIKQTPRA